MKRLRIESTALPGLYVVTADGGSIALHKGLITECEAVKDALERYAAWVAAPTGESGAAEENPNVAK